MQKEAAPKLLGQVTSLEDDELLEIIDRAKPMEYQQALLAANYDPYSQSVNDYITYLERLEASAKIAKALSNKSNQGNPSKPASKKRKKDNGNDQSKQSSNKTCTLCGKV